MIRLCYGRLVITLRDLLSLLRMWVMVFLYVMNLHLFSWVSWVWPIILLLGLTWWYLVEGFA